MTRAFTYGLTGNVTLDDRGGSAMTLTYNSMDRLVQVSAGPVVLVDYLYGADGQRAVKATPAATTHYLYEPGGALFAETDGAGNVTREYITLGGVTLAVTDSLGVSYVHNDHLSTGQKMTGDGGAVVWDASYRPFGEATITAAAASLNQRFPGQYADEETGYSDNWNRTYDPSLGRYLQGDPIGLAGGLNLYAYAGGNPAMRFDPYGLDWVDDARFYGGIAFATVAVVALAPELAVVAATGWAVGQVAGALGITGVQYAVGGWCNVDKDLLWMVAEEGLWTVGTAGAGALIKVGSKLWKAGRAADDVIEGVNASTLKRTHSIEGNASTKNVNNIADSMRKDGYKGDPIDVVEHNGEYYIIDGHHRAAAARRTDTPVDIRIVDDIANHRSNYDSIDDVLNSADTVGFDRINRRR